MMPRKATNQIKVFIVEDHTIVRQGLIALLSINPDIELVGEAGDGLSALEEIPKVKPDIVLCDLALPGMGGLELMERILRPKRRKNKEDKLKEAQQAQLSSSINPNSQLYQAQQTLTTIQPSSSSQINLNTSSISTDEKSEQEGFEEIFEEIEVEEKANPQSNQSPKANQKVPVFQGKFIVLSMYHDAQWVQKALNAGAWGYLLKGSGVKDLSLAIKAVYEGQCFLSPGAQKATEIEALSPREEEVLILLAQGHSSKEMSGILNISSRTVEHHRARLMEKLKIYDIAGLTRYAIRMGLVDVNLL